MKGVESVGGHVINENPALWTVLKHNNDQRCKSYDIVVDAMDQFHELAEKTRYYDIGFENLRYQEMCLTKRWQEKYWKKCGG